MSSGSKKRPDSLNLQVINSRQTPVSHNNNKKKNNNETHYANIVSENNESLAVHTKLQKHTNKKQTTCFTSSNKTSYKSQNENDETSWLRRWLHFERKQNKHEQQHNHNPSNIMEGEITTTTFNENIRICADKNYKLPTESIHDIPQPPVTNPTTLRVNIDTNTPTEVLQQNPKIDNVAVLKTNEISPECCLEKSNDAEVHDNENISQLVTGGLRGSLFSFLNKLSSIKHHREQRRRTSSANGIESAVESAFENIGVTNAQNQRRRKNGEIKQIDDLNTICNINDIETNANAASENVNEMNRRRRRSSYYFSGNISNGQFIINSIN